MLGLTDKADKIKSKLHSKIKGIRQKQKAEDKEINDIENGSGDPSKKKAEYDESIEREEEIIKEIESAESDIESLLKMDEAKVEDVFEYFAESLELEMKEEQALKNSLDELKQVEKELQSVKKEFNRSRKQFRQNVLNQLNQANLKEVDDTIRQAESKEAKDIPSMQAMTPEVLRNKIGRANLDLDSRQSMLEALKQEGFDSEEITKIAVLYNSVKIIVKGRNKAIEKPRYVKIEEELQEVIDIRDSVKQVAKEFKDLRDFESSIQKDMKHISKEAPESLSQLESIGEDLVALESEVEELELEEQELIKIGRKTSADSHLEAHKQIKSETSNIENNLNLIEDHIGNIAREVAELEEKDEKFEQLDEEETKELKELLNVEEGIKKVAKDIRENTINELNVLFGEGQNDNYINAGDRDLKKQVENVFNSLGELVEMIDTEAMRLDQYSRKEYEEAERFRKFSKQRFNEIEEQMSSIGFSTDASKTSRSKNRTAAAD